MKQTSAALSEPTALLSLVNGIESRRKPSIISPCEAQASNRRETLRQHFCADQGCPHYDFEQEIFRRSVTFKTVAFAWLVGGSGSKFFASDRELIVRIGEANCMEQIHEAIYDFWINPPNQTWLRRVAGLRISTMRLRRIAREYLPVSEPPPSRPGGRVMR